MATIDMAVVVAEEAVAEELGSATAMMVAGMDDVRASGVLKILKCFMGLS